jgi:hypothetical protein
MWLFIWYYLICTTSFILDWNWNFIIKKTYWVHTTKSVKYSKSKIRLSMENCSNRIQALNIVSCRVPRFVYTNILLCKGLCCYSSSLVLLQSFQSWILFRGGSRGGGGRARPPLKLEKIWFFWRKIVIFHTKYPKIFRASLRSAQFF